MDGEEGWRRRRGGGGPTLDDFITGILLQLSGRYGDAWRVLAVAAAAAAATANTVVVSPANNGGGELLSRG